MPLQFSQLCANETQLFVADKRGRNSELILHVDERIFIYLKSLKIISFR